MLKISIITAVKNRRHFIEGALQSLQRQTHSPVEHIVIDGGSTDGTLEILERHHRRISTLISEPDNGLYEALNKGIRLASGDLVGILHSDDFYEDAKVLAGVAAEIEKKNADACYGDLLYVRQNDASKITRYWRAGKCGPSKFLRGWMPPHPTLFVKRRVYESYGLFNPALGSAADYEFMLRVLYKQGISVSYIPRVLVRMRTGGMSNASLAHRLRANAMDLMAWKINGLKPAPFTMAFKPLRKLHQYFEEPEQNLPTTPIQAEYFSAVTMQRV